MKTPTFKYKINILSFSIFLAGTLLLGNVLMLDLKGRTYFVDKNFAESVGVSVTTTTDYPSRGFILDSDGNIMAEDMVTYKVIFILSPSHQKYGKDSEGNTILVDDYVSDPAYTAAKVAPILNAPEDYLYDRFTDDAYQVEIGLYGRNLTYQTKLELEALNIPGMIFESSISRYYPYNSYASYLIGYTENQIDDNGEYHIVGISGIEGELNEELTGTIGYSQYYSDPYNNPIAGGEIQNVEGNDGYNVTLTLNNVIQTALEECLTKTMNLASKPYKAWGVVMDATDGAILGYSSYPNFNPNDMDFSNYNDYVSQLPYEPGSVMKTFTYAAAVDAGVFNKDATYDNHNFYVKSANGQIVRTSKENSYATISNFDNYQSYNCDFYTAYCSSYNVGCAVLLEKYLDQEVFKSYLNKFHFLQPVDVLGIDEGSFYGSADFSTEISTINTTFGQAISVNALQIIQAYSVFCNDGMMIKPYIIKSISDPKTNEVIYSGQRTEVEQVISKESADFMLMMMEGVINGGFSSTSAKYIIPGVRVGGKSGTAEVAEDGKYTELTIHSIVLAMPIDDPQVLIYVCYQDRNNRGSQNTAFVNELERVVATVYNMTTSSDEDNKQKKIYENGLYNFVNHTLTYVRKKCDELELALIEIGSNQTVIRQYPQANSTAISGQRVMVYTGGDIVMPDMTGWSRNEVMAYWNLTGIKTIVNGYGYVSSQNIEAGVSIDATSVIEVTLN